jgi:hypothetical protein
MMPHRVPPSYQEHPKSLLATKAAFTIASVPPMARCRDVVWSCILIRLLPGIISSTASVNLDASKSHKTVERHLHSVLKLFTEAEGQ